MTKHEIKVELNDSTSIANMIESSYFKDGQMGKILGKRDYLIIDESDDINHLIFKGLNNATVKITNDVVDGYMRFMIDETQGDIRLYPISIYCIKENDKYTFY